MRIVRVVTSSLANNSFRSYRGALRESGKRSDLQYKREDETSKLEKQRITEIKFSNLLETAFFFPFILVFTFIITNCGLLIFRGSPDLPKVSGFEEVIPNQVEQVRGDNVDSSEEQSSPANGIELGLNH